MWMRRVARPHVGNDGERWPFYYIGGAHGVEVLQDIRPEQPVSDRVQGLMVRTGVQFPPAEMFARLWPNCDRVWVQGIPSDNTDEFFANLQACAPRLVLLILQVLPPSWFAVPRECWLQLVQVPDVTAINHAFGSARFQLHQCHGVTSVTLGLGVEDVRIVQCDALESADIAAAQVVRVERCARLQRLVLQTPSLLYVDLCDALTEITGEIPAGGTASVGRCASLESFDPGLQPLYDLHCDVRFPLHVNVAPERLLDDNNAFFLAHAHYRTPVSYRVPGPIVAAQRQLALNSRRNLLLMAMAGRRRHRRFGRLPPELWQLIYDEFLCDGMIFVFP